MKREAQVLFVRDIIESIKRQILATIEDIPDEWDGIELRQYICDYICGSLRVKMDKKRKRNYNNDVVVRNLL